MGYPTTHKNNCLPGKNSTSWWSLWFEHLLILFMWIWDVSTHPHTHAHGCSTLKNGPY